MVRAASLALCFLRFLALVLCALDLPVLLPLARLRLAVARKDREAAWRGLGLGLGLGLGIGIGIGLGLGLGLVHTDGHAGAARARAEVEGRGRVAPDAHRARGGADARVEEVNVRRLAEQRVVPA